MKSENSRIDINVQPNELDIPTYDSKCSCDKCDSFSCFSIRHKNSYTCKMCNAKGAVSKYADETYLSINTNIIDVPESYQKERVKKEITYDDSIVVKSLETKYPRASEKSIEKERSSDKARVCSSTSVLISKDLDSTTEQLSAQVMNVPYRDLKDSRRKKVSRITPKLTSFDVLKRIKEAYEACTCEVCECIVGRTAIHKGYCNCKPCNCKDCSALMHKLRFNGALKQANEGCPCIRCDRKKDCKGITKTPEYPYCDCDPFDYMSNSFNNPCDCKPCECIECKSYLAGRPNKIIVGQMTVDTTPSYCTCSPCDCTSCVQRLPIASSLQHEMSTGINRPMNCTCDSCMSQACESNDSNTCSCEVQRRVMTKPVEKDTHDYSIHRALVTYNNYMEKVKSSTLAMFAGIGYTFPFSYTFEQDRKACYCTKCECLVCNSSDQNENEISSTFQETLDTEPDLTNQDYCKCLSCECVVCNHNIGQNVMLHNFTKCACDICTCIQCEDLTSKKICDNNSKPNDCQSIISNFTSKCAQCNFNNKCIFSKNSEYCNKTFESISFNEDELKTNSKGNVLPMKQHHIPRKEEVIIMDQISNCDVNKLKLSYSQSLESTKFVGIFQSDTTPFQRSNSSRNVVNKCLNYVMKTTVNGEKELEKNYSSEYEQNSWSKYSVENNAFTIHRTEVMEDNSLMEPITNNTSSIKSATVLKTIKSGDIKDREERVTASSRKTLNLINSVLSSNNKNESDKTCNIIINNMQQIDDAHNVIDNEIDIDKLKYSLKQARNFSLELTKLLRQYENANKGVFKRSASITDIPGSDFCVSNNDNTSAKDNSRADTIPQLKVNQSDNNEIMEMYNSFSGYMISDTKNRNIVKKDITNENIFSLFHAANIKISGDSSNYRNVSKLDMLDLTQTAVYKSTDELLRQNELPFTKEVFCTNTNPRARVAEKDNILESVNYRSSLTRIEDQVEFGLMSELTQSSLKTVNSTEDQNGVSILKKNTTLFNSPSRKPKTVCVIPNVTLEVKNMRPIMGQRNEDFVAISNEPATCRSPNNTTKEKLEGIDNDINDLINMDKWTEKVKKDMSKINCEILKVKYLGLRRVSDHTVLVGWKPPRDVTQVEGYEILVDGRSVQKILDRSRCMAVVSCLPRIGQILITIRTLIAHQQYAHYPSSTIIYQPRLFYK